VLPSSAVMTASYDWRRQRWRNSICLDYRSVGRTPCIKPDWRSNGARYARALSLSLIHMDLVWFRRQRPALNRPMFNELVSKRRAPKRAGRICGIRADPGLGLKKFCARSSSQKSGYGVRCKDHSIASAAMGGATVRLQQAPWVANCNPSMAAHGECDLLISQKDAIVCQLQYSRLSWCPFKRRPLSRVVCREFISLIVGTTSDPLGTGLF
jgi:hypothetical protein